MNESTLSNALSTLKSVGDKLAAMIYLRWADYRDSEQEAIAAIYGTPYKPVLPGHLRWQYWCNCDPDQLPNLFSRELVPALEQLSNCQHNPLAIHLHRIAPLVAELQSEAELKIIVNWVGKQPFETHHARRQLLDRFDSILHKSPDKYSSQFLSPHGVAQLLVELASPLAGERVYDPCFGSAQLLTASIDFVQRHSIDRVPHVEQPLLQVSGVEIDTKAYAIGLTRLALAGVPEPKIELGNAFERTPLNRSQQEGFDLVIANPPWGGKVELVGMDHFPIQTNDSAALFIQHAMTQLRLGGRAVIVVPPSILFGSGALQMLRQWLLEQHTIEAVIGLPKGTLQPHSNITSSIIIVRRGGTTSSVRMVDSDVILNTGRGPEESWIDSNVVRTLAENLHSHPNAKCWDVSVEDLASIDFDLTPRRRDLNRLDERIDSLEEHADILVLPMSQICCISAGRSIRASDLMAEPPRSNTDPSGGMRSSSVEKSLIDPPSPHAFADSPIPYIRIRDVRDGHTSEGHSWIVPTAASNIQTEWKLRSGDILLSKSGTIGKSGLVRNSAVGGVASSGFFVLRVENKSLVDPHYLLSYLQGPECQRWLDDHSRGSATRHLPMSMIWELPVPLPPLPIQRRVVEQCQRSGIEVLAALSRTFTDEGDRLSESLDIWVEIQLMGLLRRNDEQSVDAHLGHLEEIVASLSFVRNCTECGAAFFDDYSIGGVDELSDSVADESPNTLDQTSSICDACDFREETSSLEFPLSNQLREMSELILAFHNAMHVLGSISQMKDASALLTALQFCQSRLFELQSRLNAQSGMEGRLQLLTHEVLVLLAKAISGLLASAQLEVRDAEAYTREDGSVVLLVHVVNSGRLPIRNLVFTSTPHLFSTDRRIAVFGPGETQMVQFIGKTRSDEHVVRAHLNWTAMNVDGNELSGNRELAVSLTTTPEVASNAGTELGASPYICGDPVKTDRPDVFVGREELLDQIRRQIMQSGNVVLLEGNRRAGKSSILWHLEGSKAVPGWLGVYCSLQGTEGDRSGGISTEDVFRGIAYEIVQSVRRFSGKVVLPDGSILEGDRKLGIMRSLRHGISADSPFADFREYLELLLDSLSSSGLGLLLMIDEFDKLQEGIDKGVTSPQVPENIRFLVQTYPRFSAVLTGSRRLKRLREEYWSALFGLGTRFGVTSLPKEPASRLVSEPVKGMLSYSHDAIDLAYKQTAGQPYLLQCLCNRVFDIAARDRVRSITVDQVQRASTALVEDNEHFASLWDFTKFDRRRFLLALIHREESGPDPLRLGVLEEKLTAYGVDIDEDTLISDLEELRELELIDLNGESRGAHYTLSIPMMGDWIQHQQDFEVLRSRARTEREDSHE